MVNNLRINYTVEGYNKLLLGTLESEDDNFIVVKARDGVIFRINKVTINEIREMEGDQ